MENVLITGASTGIGYSLCKIYLEKGYQVIGSVRKEDDAAKLSNEFGEHFHALLFDVTDHKAVEGSVDKVKELIGDRGLSCLINNAGIAVSGPVMLLSMEDYQHQFDVNLFGVIAVTKAFLPMLGAVKGYGNEPGKILNISSVSGQIAFPFLSPYCASKFALEAFTDSLRREMLLYGIDVISIEPGAIKTPIWTKGTELPPQALKSDYASVLEKFHEQTSKAAKAGMDPDVLAKKIFEVYRKKKPKTRYVFMNDKFTNFTVPRFFITPRKFDGFIKKMFFK